MNSFTQTILILATVSLLLNAKKQCPVLISPGAKVPTYVPWITCTASESCCQYNAQCKSFCCSNRTNTCVDSPSLPASTKSLLPFVDDEDGEDEGVDDFVDVGEDGEDGVGLEEEEVIEVVQIPIWELTECLVFNNDLLDYFGQLKCDEDG